MSTTKAFIVGNKLMGICGECGNLIRLDKPILGSIHFCLTQEERALKASNEYAAKYLRPPTPNP